MEAPSLLKELEVVREVGAGGFGIVLQANWQSRNEDVAIKIEPASHSNLELEYEIFKRMSAVDPETTPVIHGFCQVKGEGNFLIMELLQCNLSELVASCHYKSPEILALGVQMIERIRACHEVGFLHRDIKPQNFMIRRKMKGCRGHTPVVCLIDYGLATKYLDKDACHKVGKAKHFLGTAKYTSSWNLRGQRQGRRDDMESWVYSMIDLLRPKLPWHYPEHASSRSNKRETMLEMRETAIVNSEAFRNVPPVIENIFKCVRKLEYDERPQYEKYISMILAECNGEIDSPPNRLVDADAPVFSGVISASVVTPISSEDRTDSNIAAQSPMNQRRRRRSFAQRLLGLCSVPSR